MPGSPGFWRRLLPRHATADATATQRYRNPAPLSKRDDLSDGAVAGLTVGVIVFSLLLVLCLYPVIVGCVKRRKRDKRLATQQRDAEAAVNGQIDGHDAEGGAHPRVSSSDSLKNSSALARGYDFEQDAVIEGEEDDPVTIDDPTLRSFVRYGPETAQAAVEYMPQDLADDQPGVLKGTSEDYYRASIPSSAFGMVDQPVAESMLTTSRASSLSHNLRHMFRRKSDRNQTLNSAEWSSNGDEQGATPLQRIITSEEPMAHSPTQLSPRSSPPPQAAALRPPPPSTTSRSISAEPNGASLSNASLSNTSSPRALLKSPSPPYYPAPGTVNPMDIMAPSTESELWHRTEHELYTSSYESPTSQLPQPIPQELEYTFPDNTNQSSSPSVHGSTIKHDSPEQVPLFTQQDVEMAQASLLQANSLTNGRHPSFPSEHSTPLPGPAFTDVSSQATPSTQLDTPSPESRHSSDYRHSVSPGLVAHHVPSPVKNQDGLYQCDEPGCTQSFDQPHKLKFVEQSIPLQQTCSRHMS